MTVEATIQKLLEESKNFQKTVEIEEEALKPSHDGDEPSNKKNNVQDQKAAEGGTSKKANRVTQGADAPEGMAKLKEEEETTEEVVAEETKEEIAVDMSEDVSALFNGEEGLTEEFRQKAETIFEAAVTSRVKQEVARIEESFEQKLQEAIEESVEGLVEHVDGYLNLMVEQWMENNAVALESGMKSDILESFVGGLKSLFEQHYIDMPEEKFDLVGDMESQIEALKGKVDESVATIVDLRKELNEHKRAEVISSVCEGLTAIEAEKLQTLAEEISFEDAESFAGKMQTIRENYFAKTTVKAEAPSILTEETIQEEKAIPAEMKQYVTALNLFAR